MKNLFGHGGFRWLWLGQLLSQLGSAVFLVMGLWEIQLRSPFLLSLAGLAMAVPQLLAIFGGALVDRYDARILMLLTDLLRGLAVLGGTLALTLPGSLPVVVIALLAVNSLGSALFAPSEAVLIPQLVVDEDLPAANGFYALTSQLSQALGSAIGGAAIAAIGIAVVFFLDAGSFWLSALAIVLVIRQVPRARPAMPHGSGDGGGNLWREGLQGLRQMPWLLRILPSTVLINFTFMVAFTMLPYWIRHVLSAGPAWYGITAGAWAMGTTLGSILVAQFARLSPRVVAVAVSVVQAIAIAGFAVSSQTSLSALLLLVAGASNGIVNAVFFTIVQRLVPEHLRGRTFGLIISLLTMAMPAGALVAGLLLRVAPLPLPWLVSSAALLYWSIDVWRHLPDRVAGYGAVENV